MDQVFLSPSSDKNCICKYCNDIATDGVDCRCSGPCKKIIHMYCATQAFITHMNMSCNPKKFYCISCSIDNLKKNLSKFNISASTHSDTEEFASTVSDTEESPDRKNLTNQFRTDFTQHVQGYIDFQKCIEKVCIESKKCAKLIEKFSKIEIDMLISMSNEFNKLEPLRTEMHKGWQNNIQIYMVIRYYIKTLQEQCQEISKGIAELKDEVSQLSRKHEAENKKV